MFGRQLVPDGIVGHLIGRIGHNGGGGLLTAIKRGAIDNLLPAFGPT
jgi:hypothetical protein